MEVFGISLGRMFLGMGLGIGGGGGQIWWCDLVWYFRLVKSFGGVVWWRDLG